VICNPEVEAKWAVYDPENAGAKLDASEKDDGHSGVDLEGDEHWRVEHAPRLLTDGSDPLCDVESLRVRFVDESILSKSGIVVERVERRAISATLELPGEVEFDATRTTRVTPRVGGIVLAVQVTAGVDVEAGEVLAIVDSPTLGESKNEFISREQNLRLAEADLKRVEMIARGVGRMLEVGTEDASTDSLREAVVDSPVGAAKSKMLRAHAALQLARAESEREEALLERDVSSRRDYQAARSALAAAAADFVALREEIAFDVERSHLETSRAVEVARTALESSRRRLRILGLTASQVEQVGREADEMLSQFELRSPTAGRVIELSVSAGESVGPDETLFVVADLSTMWLVADAYERDLSQLGIGQSVLFTVDGMPGRSFEGRLSWISSQVDDRTRTIRVRADLPNPDGILRAKMYGQARVLLHGNEDVLTAPEDAVQTDGCCQLVFVRESPTVFLPRKVTLGAASNGYVEVLRGLESGDMVASVGSFLMKTEILKSNIGAGCCEVDPGR
jgi:RND family efflux transporter MFP subunit